MVDETELIRIGIAEGAVLVGAGTLSTTGLGSCIGLVLYDAVDRVAGMIHVMLPESPSQTPALPQKYADTGVKWLYESLLANGAHPTHLQAKYAGGAHMFRTLHTDALRIGERNIAAIAEQLERYRVPIVGRDVGGHAGRTVRFELPSCQYYIRTARGEERVI